MVLKKRREKLLKNRAEKEHYNYCLAVEWIKLFQCKKGIAEYLLERRIFSVIIYGLSDIGCLLYEELKESGVHLVCILDQNAFGKIGKTEIFSPKGEIPKADVIIVATPYYLVEIENVLLHKVECPIVALDDLIADILAESIF